MNGKLLVVDDDPRVLSSVQLLFKNLEVVGASSANEVFESIKGAHDLDLILLDVRLGRENGLQILKKLRTLDPHIKVIVMTAFWDKEIIVGALQGRADDYIDKPFDPVMLVKKIDGQLADTARYDSADRHTYQIVNRVKRVIQKNFSKRVKLHAVSKLVSLSPKYLSRLFREETGQSFTTFRLTSQMNIAKKYLDATPYRIDDIAARLGYQNPEAFMKAFKRITGMTPTGYRLRNNRSS